MQGDDPRQFRVRTRRDDQRCIHHRDRYDNGRSDRISGRQRHGHKAHRRSIGQETQRLPQADPEGSSAQHSGNTEYGSGRDGLRRTSHGLRTRSRQAGDGFGHTERPHSSDERETVRWNASSSTTRRSVTGHRPKASPSPTRTRWRSCRGWMRSAWIS